MKGMIDQVDGILYFGDYNGEAIVPLLKFDKEINYICTEMNELAFEIFDGEGNAMEVEKQQLVDLKMKGKEKKNKKR